MPLSPRIIKAQNSVNQLSSARIETEILLETPLEKTYEQNPELTKILLEKRKAEQLIAEAKEEKERILQETRQEAEKLLVDARSSGYTEGEKLGIQEGYQAGYISGMQKAQEEAEKLKEAANRRLDEAAQYVTEYYSDKKNEVIELAAAMAEKIIHEKIDTSEEKVISLITPVLRRMNQKNQFITLSVTPEQVALVKEKLPSFEENYPQFRFAVFADETLEKNGCIIESNEAVVDQQIHLQLAAMVKDLQLLEV